MPVKGIEQTKRRMRETFQRIAGPMTERTIMEILIIGSGAAALLTPVDTSNLINSQYRVTGDGPLGKWGRVGYTAAYAAAVHAMSGKLRGQPRADFGTTRAGVSFGGGTGVGNYWDPRAEPQFLAKGFERSIPAIKAAIERGMKL